MGDKSKIIDLTGKWLFQPADKAEFSQKDFNDLSWYRIPIQNEWRMHGIDYEGNAWYRLHFRTGPSLQGQNLGLVLPPIASASFVYCNGSLIGMRGAEDGKGNIIRASEQASHYLIPASIITPQADNVIAVRVLSYHGVGGIFGNDWLYLGAAELIQNRFITLILLTAVMAAGFIVMGLYHLILLYARNTTEYLYFALISFAMGLHLLGMNGIGYWFVDNFTMNQLFIHTAVGIFPIAMAGYLREHYEIRSSKALKILEIGGWILSAIIVAHLVFDALVKIYVRYILPVGIILVIASIAAMVGYTVRAWRRAPAAKILATGFLIFCIAVTNDMLQYLSLPIQVKFADVGFLIVVLCMATAMAVKIQRAFQEKTQAQEQIVYALQRADKLKDDFLANTSHELRTPLFGIMGLTESLLKKGEFSGLTRDNLELIMMSSNRLARLVDDILDMSKLKNRAITLSQKPVDIHQAVDIAYRILQPMIGTKNISLQNLIPADAPLVYADENRLQQILHNLIGNAIKFTAAGYIRVTAEKEENQVQVSVEDTGIGIAADKLELVFNAFEQIEGSLERQYGGAGLGLSITRRLVELHGGTISVTSQPGEGSVFRFSLPLTAEKGTVLNDETSAYPGALSSSTPVTQAEISRIQETPLEGIQVMVADDEPVNLRLIQQFLEEIGITPRTAADGATALEVIESQDKWDLVLLDVMMPGMNGFKVCEKIRERWPATELPVIFLTARGSTTDLVKGFALGANDYLPKPVGREEIIARIQTQLSLTKARADQLKLNDIRKELELARNIQRASLPLQIPASAAWKLAVDFEPMALIGGDFYSFLPVDAARLGLFVADVSGHGIPAALIASMLSISFSLQKPVASEPAELLRNVNTMVYHQLEGNFVTSCYVFVDTENRRLLTGNAGHPPVIKLGRAGGEIELLKPRGKVHGIALDVEYAVQETPLHSGDRIILYSDGIIEAGGTESELYGQDRFMAFIQENRTLEPEDFAKALRDEITAFTGRPVNYADDFTLIVCDIR